MRDHPLHHPHHRGRAARVIDLAAAVLAMGIEQFAARGGHRGDQVGLQPPPARLEHLIAGGELKQVDLIGPQGHRQPRMQRHAGEPEAGGEVADAVGPGLLRQPDGDRVDGAGEGVLHAHLAGVSAAVVLRGPVADAGRRVAPQVGGLDAGLEGRGVHERLERRARLPLGLDRPVEGAEAIACPADQGADRPVGPEGHQGRLLGAGAAALRPGHPAHDIGRLALQPGLDGELDDEVGGGPLRQLHRLGLGEVQGVAEILVFRRFRSQRGGRCDGGALLGGRDPALLDHPAQHQPRADQGAGHVVHRREAGRGLGQGGQQGGFGQGQRRRGLAEIGL